MKTKKTLRFVSVILSLLMVMSVMSIMSVSADTTDENGTTGSCTWRYDGDLKALYIQGSGATEDYMIGGVPWYNKEIESVYFSEGITKIGANFCCVDNPSTITFVSFPQESLIEIGKFAFKGCGIDYLHLPDTVTTISEGAFQDCVKIEDVYLSKNLESIAYLSFANTTFKKAYIPRNVSFMAWRAFGTYRSDLSLYYAPDAPCAQTVINYATEMYTTIVAVVFDDISVKAGEKKWINVNCGFNADNLVSSNTAVAKVADGQVTGIKKGTVKLTGEIFDGSKIEGTVTVTSNPSLRVGGKAYKSSTTYNVLAGKNLAVKVTGKASSVNNVYSSTNAKVAKVTSKANATTVNIKGLKKGKATITIKVNGVAYKVKVNVMAKPTLKVNGKAYKASTTYKVKKGKTITVKITGKDSSVKNVYSTSNKKVAKVTSKTTATTVKIKGLKKGKATITVKVNTVAFKIKVQVK